MKTLQNKNKHIVLSLLAIGIGMFGLAYASVPLYNLFCRVTGYGGATRTALYSPEKILDREITIRFNTDVAGDLPWEFASEQKETKVRIGENKLAFFYARNLSGKATKGTALYNVTPNKVGIYFNKIQCFCFDEQIIEPGQKIQFPVSFFVDPEIAKDKNMDDVKTITLSYTFFRVKDDS